MKSWHDEAFREHDLRGFRQSPSGKHLHVVEEQQVWQQVLEKRLELIGFQEQKQVAVAAEGLTVA